MRRLLDPLLALLGIAAIAISLIGLAEATRGVGYAPLTVAGTPARVYRAPLTQPGPAVVIAHGFAGSQQLMGAFATTLARAGYIAVTFDFAGHGANPTQLGGSVDDLEGATRVLVEETRRVAEVARALGDGRLAILGHSMASDIVVRTAQEVDDIAATIAVSMFSPAVTAQTPANLLVIAGEWEGRLREEALRAVALALPEGEVAREGVTYGDFAEGTARRAVFASHVEHVGVLFSAVTLAETRAWLDAAFGRASPPDAHLDGRGPFVVLLLLGSVLLARPLSRLLPAVVPTQAGGGLPWRFFWIVLVGPMVLTPILLTFVPTQILPVLVADYLVAHFALYGILTALSLVLARRLSGIAPCAPRIAFGPFALASLAAIAYFALAFAAPIDLFLTAFAPVPHRVPLIAAILIGTASFFLADAWATHGPNAARGAYPATKAAFLVSLGIAVALDFERLLFLLIIVPVVVAFMIVFGAVGAVLGRATRHPAVPGLLNALVFAYALGVTFPLLSGR